MNAFALAVGVLTVISALSTVRLVWAARREHIGALTERALLATVLSLFGALYTAAIVNTESGFVFLDASTAMTVLRVAVVALLLVPVYWTVLYLRGQLGDNGRGGR